jgi:hypothetical protein
MKEEPSYGIYERIMRTAIYMFFFGRENYS